MGTSSVNPASLYGPDGKPYAPWMIGKVSEGPSKLSKFSYVPTVRSSLDRHREREHFMSYNSKV